MKSDTEHDVVVKSEEKSQSLQGKGKRDGEDLGKEVAVVKKPRLDEDDDDDDDDDWVAELMKSEDDYWVAELMKEPQNFDHKKAAYWVEGESVPFLFLAKAFGLIEHECKRSAIIGILTNMLRTVINTTPHDLLNMVYLCSNRAYQGLVLGDATVIKALAKAYTAQPRCIAQKYKVLGDLGLVAKEIQPPTPTTPKPLTVAKVFSTFQLIAKKSGKDSQKEKINYVHSLLIAATDCEPQYLIQLLQRKLRIGLSERTLLAALGHVAVYSAKHSSPSASLKSSMEEAEKIVKQVYSVIPVYDKIVPALLSGDVFNLQKTCPFSLGIPVEPMLPSTATQSVSQVIEIFQDREFTCEYKYDGVRAQIHYMENGTVEIYSRNAECKTEKFPGVVAAISRLKKPFATSFVLDCELVAYDHEKQKILPFQLLNTRAHENVVASDIKVNVCVYAFDILYLNGQPLLQEPLNVRREHLCSSFEEEPAYFQFATSITSNDHKEITQFLEAAVNASCEGLIIKSVDSTYEPSKHSNNWLKLEKDHIERMGDSLDLVPIAAFRRPGKRTGVYGSFLLACYDSDKKEFQSICSIGAGFSDNTLEELSARNRANVIPKSKSKYSYAGKLKPDVWFEPTEVWEVKAAELTISSSHCAANGIVDPEKGFSLRFPLFLGIREDKTPEQATSAQTVASMYNAQRSNWRVIRM